MANMFLTTAGYYINGGDGPNAALSGLRALRESPGILMRLRRVRQLAYCLLGTTFVYRKARASRDRMRG